MTECLCRYADWKAPAEDGHFLIWPEPPELPKRATANHQLLQACDGVLVQNAPLPVLRAAARQWIGHANPDQLLLATGHQTELYHPGVWAKDVLIAAAAKRTGAAAYHFAVDTDSPKHLHVKWPGGSIPITDDPRLNSAPWTGLLDPPSPEHIDQISREIEHAQRHWSFTPAIRDFLDPMRRLRALPTSAQSAIRNPQSAMPPLESRDLAWTLTSALHEFDSSLGLRHSATVTSPLWQSPSYLALVHHILSRADKFAADYNHSLADYRQENGIANPGRPWPDLRISADACEVPFWCDTPATQRRARASVTRSGGRWIFKTPAGEFAFDPQKPAEIAADELLRFLRQSGLILPPRALTLTLFLRLFLCDLFVHGIGGGRYDQVTDRLIARHFNLSPPAFAVATATLYFPEASRHTRIDIRPMLQEGRRIRHGAFSADKMRLVQEIESAPRRSPQRATLFRQMHARLAEAMRRPPFTDWEHQVTKARDLAAEQATIFDRELFYALQPADRLQSLIHSFAARF